MKDFPFIGREDELSSLYNLTCKKTSSLVAICGRRRIGKSRLVEEFAKKNIGCKFLSFSGLAPSDTTTADSQREEFAKQLSEKLSLPPLKSDDWSTLFTHLAREVRNGKVVILFDEISWMGGKDKTFVGKLKNAWDLEFKNNSELVLILCGSVSAWIEKNILRHTGFVGRFSLVLDLDELSIKESNEFLNKMGFCSSAYERCKILAVTGGVPRYIEEVNPNLLADENIKNMCFKKSGILFREFESIFSDIFSRRSKTYENILRELINGCKELGEIAISTEITKNGHLSEYMLDLIKSGFVKRDLAWNIKEKSISKLGFYRLSDNYLRFYLKYIEPNSNQIVRGHFNYKSLSTLPAFESIMALQFENLVLGNGNLVIKKLGVGLEDVINDGAYFQRAQKSRRIKGCQIDYLVQLKSKILYACEIKFSINEVGVSVVSEMQEKLQRFSIPKGFFVIPVLIHINGVSDSVVSSDYFRIIDFTEMMQ